MRGVNLLAAVLQQNRYGRKVAYTASILLFTLSACTVFPLSFDGSGAQATSGFSVPATPVITLSTTNNAATVDIVINNALGVFASSTTEGTASFDVTTDNATGYTLSIVADDNTGMLSDNSGNEIHTIASISDKLAESTFNNSAYNNKWGYKPNKYYDTVNDQTVTNTGSGAVYLPSPTTVATILDKTTAANAEGNEYTIALGIRADYDTVDGTYTNMFNLIATGNPVPYIITYNANTNDTVTNMPITQPSSTNADYVALASETPVRNDHIFLGWCPSQPTTSNGIDICSGTVYQPGDDYGLDHTATTNDTLYAMWQSGTTRTYLQDITPETCPTQPTIVYDSRDNEPYTIQKLADGNCWFLDNLRLGSTEETIILSSEDTNIESVYILPVSRKTDFGSYTTAQINAESKTKSAFYGVTGEGKIGVYYNYCAATAGTYCYEEGEAAGNATQDLCPKGWRMPTGDNDGEYQTLYGEYGSYADFKNALRSPLSGYYLDSSHHHQHKYGSFWSNTKAVDDHIYSLDVRQASVPEDWLSNRNVGISIRCMMAAPVPEHIYIQDVTPATCPIEPTVVYDRRDEEEYTIQKLEDGNCWMLDNLRLDNATIINPISTENTNIPSETSFTLPTGKTGNFNSYTTPEVYTRNKNMEITYGEGTNKAGVYYNYCAATAGTVCSDSDNQDAIYDICPKGWRLPIGGNGGEFDVLSTAYNRDEASFRNALRIPLVGFYGNNTSISNVSSYGYTWSASWFSKYNTYILALHATLGTIDSYDESGVGYYGGDTYHVDKYAATGGRKNAMPMRCIAGERAEKIYIQDITIDSCPTTPTKVYDLRDEEPYSIQKLADGNCWMLENLRTDQKTLKYDLSSENTNMPADATFSLPEGIRDSFNSYDQPRVFTAYKNTNRPYGESGSKLGVYYNFCAASAGTYCYSNGSGAGDAEYDICPKGWRMPTGGENGEYEALYGYYGEDDILLKDRLRLVMGGAWFTDSNFLEDTSESTTIDLGRNGQFWSSTRSDGGNMYKMVADTATADFDNAGARYNGFSVRCIVDTDETPEPMPESPAPTDPNTPHYIQDVTAETCPKERTAVYDKRDEKKYYIQEITITPYKTSDSTLCMMTSNLNLDGGITLNSETSNIEDGTTYTLPTSNMSNFANSSEAVYSSGERTCDIGQPCYSYYDYTVATAGSGPGFGDAKYDICPKGWRLPTNDEYWDFGSNFRYSSERSRYPWYGVYAGIITYQGKYYYMDSWDATDFAEYWTSSADNSSNENYAYTFSYDSKYYYSSKGISTGLKTSGLAVRCIIDERPEEKIYMQDITQDSCPTTRTKVYDRRDEKEYYIQKITSGDTTLCWMTSNLDLAGGSALYSDDSNVPDNYSKRDNNPFYTLPASSVSGFNDGNIASMYNSESAECGNDGPCYSYYNYSAATAGTNPNNGNATYDICPKGWGLPTSNEYSALAETFTTGEALMESPWYGVRAGSYSNNQLLNGGSTGYYLAATGNSSSASYLAFTYNNSGVYSEGSKNLGYSVRCVAREGEKRYIQDVNMNNCPTHPIKVYDVRDDESYYVQKLKDGNCWMLENLRLGSDDSTINLTPSDTNINSNYTLPASVSSGFSTYTESKINTGSKNLLANYSGGKNKIGVYYNYCAATAGTICDTYESDKAEYDICPKGWRLPTGGNNGEYSILVNKESNNVRSAFRATLSGGYNNNSPVYRNNTGHYWTSTSYDSTLRYIGYPSGSSFGVSTRNNRNEGASIRCVAKNPVIMASSLIYDANGGTGSMPSYNEVDFSTRVAAENGFTRDGYEFTGWNTAADGSGISVEEYDSLLDAATAMGLIDNGGTLILYAQWNPLYTVSYNKNGGDTGTMANRHNNLKENDSITLAASNYSHAGYGFTGWSTDADAGTKLANGQNVTIYGPNQTIKITPAFLANADSSNMITLYAVWLPQDATRTMQSFTTAECTAMEVGDILALKDTRDNEVYAVAKLGDNHCWMIENLRINPATATFTADNTNNPTQAFLDNVAQSSSSTTLCNTDDASCDDTIQYNLNNMNRSLTASHNSNNNSSSWYSYGGMYNWYTATAGNGTYSKSSGSVSGDICPAGWRLPTGGDSGEYKALNTAINGGKTNDGKVLLSFPNNFVMSGDYNNTTTGGRGTYTRLWSATATNNKNAYRMGITPTEVTPVKNWGKWDGFAVRCVVK